MSMLDSLPVTRADDTGKRRRSARLAGMLLALAVAACVPHKAPPPAPTGIQPAGFPPALYTTAPAGSVYRIDPARSSLQLKVYRAGALAGLGHNHVIDGALDGFIYLPDDRAAAQADLFVRVADFVIDAAASRRAAGDDFASTPSAQDIAGTRANMLGPKLLDAVQFPFLLAHVAPRQIDAESAELTLVLTVRDHTAHIPVVVAWRQHDDEIDGDATFSVSHTMLGLEPFSALGGALRVDETIDAHVVLVAAREPRVSHRPE
jgi:hypothetical protein